MQVLDLLSSRVSHLPEAAADIGATGPGMNAEALAQNPRLEARIVPDLIAQPALPFPDNSFDLAFCSVSMEYLIRPVAVLPEPGRALKPGSAAVITFSNRRFPTRAIESWMELYPFERMGLVLEHFRQAGNFAALHGESLRGLPRPKDDRYAGQFMSSAPRVRGPGSR